MFNETADKLFSQMPTIGGMKEHLDQRTRGDRYIWGLVIVPVSYTHLTLPTKA